MTKISRDDPKLDMKRRSGVKYKKHGPGNSKTTHGDNIVTAGPVSSSTVNGSITTNGVARDPCAHYSDWPVASSSPSRFPEINVSGKKIGYHNNQINDIRGTRLFRSQSDIFRGFGHDRTLNNFHQIKHQSIRESNEGVIRCSEDSSETSDTPSRVLTDSVNVNSILERNYQHDFDGISARVGSIQHTPYFSKWKISGFTHDKVVLTSLTTMSETQEVTPEFVQYIRERDAAVEESKKAQSELRETQCKLYDAMLLIEKLEQKVKNSEANHKTNKTNKKTSTTKKKSQDTSVKGSTLSVKGSVSVASSGVSSMCNSFVSSARAAEGGIYHPPITDLEPIADSREYYWKLAEKFPTLPMFQILDAEKKFIKADIDNNGYIDKDELDKVLSDTVGLFTPKKLDEIFKEVDIDNSETLDFNEVLFVLNKLFSRRRTNLPQSVQQNYSKTCNIQ